MPSQPIAGITRLPRQRLNAQALAGGRPEDPAGVVARLGMLQAQDYLGALWAIGLRMPAATEAAVEQAVAERRIVRTWPARGTLHFVAAADVRWLLALLAPRAIAASAGRFRQLGLDAAAVARSRKVLERALRGGRHWTRAEVYAALEAAGVSTAGQRGIHLVGRLAQEGLLCFGPRAGKQPTFTLLEEWVPAAPALPWEAALAEVVRRYFASHGPATLADFTWWSGLTAADARAGLELAGSALAAEDIAGRTYWRAASAPPARPAAAGAQLLPAFDEYLVGYRDRSAVLAPEQARRVNAGGGLLNPVIVIDGRVYGTWRRVLKPGRVLITPGWFAPPSAAHQRALQTAARAYGAFLGLEAELA